MNSKIETDKNIALIGMPGCGKTTIGKAVAERLLLPFHDVDKYIEKKEGKLIKDIFINGEAYFRKLESQAIKELNELIPSVISTGGGSVKIPANMETLKKSSVIFFINRPLENIAGDIDTASRPLLAEGSAKLYKLYEERYPLYKKYCDFEILNDGGLEDAADKIVEIIQLGFFNNLD